ncbi:MAG: hypothetical protein ACYDHY_07870 [Acidiferrobacterales bacterium]
MRYRPGERIRFTYNPIAKDEDTGEPFKEVLVLNPLWRGKMQGIDLKRLTPAEVEVFDAILDPDVKLPHRLPIVNDVLKRMNPLVDIKNPVVFYAKFVKVFLKTKDAYRQYYPARMTNVSIVQQTHITGDVKDPTPEFQKIDRLANKKHEPVTKPDRLSNKKPTAHDDFLDRLRNDDD